MDNRKMYVRPAIAAEDVLEQTSLACHATEPMPPMIGTTCFAGQPVQNWAPGTQMDCSIDVSKGGAFWDDAVCTSFPQEVVVLS